jgi:ferredoxin
MRICPTEAIIVSEPYSELVEKISIVNNKAEISCEQDVLCIGHIDDSILFALASRGAEEIHIKYCKKCNKGVDVNEEIERIKNLPLNIKLSYKEENQSRLKLPKLPKSKLERLRKYTLKLEVIKRESVNLNKGIPEKRELLLSSTRKISNIPNYYFKEKFVMKQIDFNKCEYMGTCVTLCPTGALRKDDRGKITYRPDLCVKCKVCIESCLLRAIENIEVDPKDVIEGSVKVIADFKLKRCEECGNIFVARRDDDKYCYICKHLNEELKSYFKAM